ncbi:hypothetical protein XENTR_v10006992 [Xenopus tropicalis]|nr:hypothetical protein XENTR_v10006992 [Xenopus tropicalis]
MGKNIYRGSSFIFQWKMAALQSQHVSTLHTPPHFQPKTTCSVLNLPSKSGHLQKGFCTPHRLVNLCILSI